MPISIDMASIPVTPINAKPTAPPSSARSINAHPELDQCPRPLRMAIGPRYPQARQIVDFALPRDAGCGDGFIRYTDPICYK
jgi:hypothetical protein